MKNDFHTLKQKGQKLPVSVLDQYFQSLDSADIEDFQGIWKGGYFQVGSSYEKYLNRRLGTGWCGKEFVNPNHVRALVMSLFGQNFRLALIGSAVLRKLEFRNQLSVAMIYNYLPVIDHFRKIDRKTMMGIMTIKGKTEVYFYLSR